MEKINTLTGNILPISVAHLPLSELSEGTMENFRTKKNCNKKYFFREQFFISGLLVVLSLFADINSSESLFSFEAKYVRGVGRVPVRGSLSSSIAAAERMAAYNAVKNGNQRIAQCTEAEVESDGTETFKEHISLTLTATIVKISGITYRITEEHEVIAEAEIFLQPNEPKDQQNRHEAADSVVKLLSTADDNDFTRLKNLCSALELIGRNHLPAFFYRYESSDTVSVDRIRASIQRIVSNMTITKEHKPESRSVGSAVITINGIETGNAQLKNIAVRKMDGSVQIEQRVDLGILGLLLVRNGFDIPTPLERV